MATSSIVLGGGCFWCLEAAYQLIDGVVSALPGYAGGTTANPSYEQVCTGTTGHAEVVRVVYDPTVIDLQTVLAVFWIIHDPTSLNRQGADSGTEYASAIFYEAGADVPIIQKSLSEAQALLKQPIVTRIEPLQAFYDAEAYHHNYFQNNPAAGYCRAVIEPKLRTLRRHFADKLAKN